ncbi:hypothetical protein DKP78_25905, partial [Enterococcus faecium]
MGECRIPNTEGPFGEVCYVSGLGSIKLYVDEFHQVRWWMRHARFGGLIARQLMGSNTQMSREVSALRHNVEV